MKKISILKRKIYRNYHNKKNWEYSEMKGYPKGTYFGFASYDDFKNEMIREYVGFYGPGLKYWNYD